MSRYPEAAAQRRTSEPRRRKKMGREPLLRRLFVLLVAALVSVAVAQDRELVVAQGIDVPSFDVHSPGSSVTTVESVIVNIFDYLVWRTADGEFEPALATAWEPVAPDAWRFTLREGVKWHDGEEFTAEDVEFTLERISRDESLSEYENYRQITDVEVVNDHEVIIHTDGPDPILVSRLSRLNSGIAPKHYVGAVGWERFGLEPVGTGPFRLVEWRRDDRIVLEAFEDHWRGAPAYDQLVFRVIPEDSTRVAELITGGVDVVVNVPVQDRERIDASGVARVELQPSTFVNMVVFNVNEGTETADARVREAIDRAIDRELLVEGVMGGLGAVTAARLAPGINAAPVDRYFGVNPYDPARARELLAGAGFEPGALKIKLYGSSGRHPMLPEQTEIIAAMLEEVGISTEIEILEFSAYSANVWNAAAFEHLVVTGLGNSMRDNWFAMRALYCDGSYAERVGWCNERFDEVMTAAETEVDAVKRAELLHEATDIVATERPWITLFQQQNLTGIANHVDWSPRADELLWMFEATAVD
jgi:peptide/nickel transport system substrate-binding protein